MTTSKQDETKKLEAMRLTQIHIAGLRFELATPLDSQPKNVLSELNRLLRQETLKEIPWLEVIAEIARRPLRILGLKDRNKSFPKLTWFEEKTPCVIVRP